jgi:hypothetical protein
VHCRKIYFSFRLDMGLGGFRLQGWGLGDHLVSQRCQGIVSSAWLLCRPGRIVGEVVGLIRSLVCIPGPGFNVEHFETGCAPTNFKVFKVGVPARPALATLKTLKSVEPLPSSTCSKLVCRPRPPHATLKTLKFM